MRTGGLFRRNSTVSPKSDEDYGDYATIISFEDEPNKLKEYITRLYKSLKDKNKSLKSAYAKLDLLNSEITKEETKFNDIVDENKSLRDQMQSMADQLASKEEEFNLWQAKLVEQTQRERYILVEEMGEERAHFTEQIDHLEDALNLANAEITRLTIEMVELANPRRNLRRSSTSTSYDSQSSMELFLIDKKNDDKNELTKQILEITQRRISLQTELTILEEANEDLKTQYKQITKENQLLRRENDGLKQQVGKRLFMKSLEDINLDD